MFHFFSTQESKSFIEKKYAENNTIYSRWCTGARPIPMEILRIYEENYFEVMEEDFRCKIIPNLINESQERPTLFISGVAGIGKSEFAKYYVDKNIRNIQISFTSIMQEI